jgi:translation initiation factor IF-3
VDEKGEQVGVVPTDQAKQMARERGYDLVEVAPQSRPPVCKLLDYGKFLYELKKKRRESSRKRHVQQIKEIRLRPKTDKHDLQTKIKRARRFLTRGDKVVFTVIFRGRENVHKDRGVELLKKVAAELEDLAKMEGRLRPEGNRMHLSMLPKPQTKTVRKVKEEKKAEKKPEEKPEEKPGKEPEKKPEEAPVKETEGTKNA